MLDNGDLLKYLPSVHCEMQLGTDYLISRGRGEGGGLGSGAFLRAIMDWW